MMAEQLQSSNPTAASGIMKPMMYKNRLQEYTQKSSIPLPVYQTVNEGSSHAPRFRSAVYVDGSYYRSPNTFSNRKEAEQHIAKMTFESISQKPKEEAFPFLSQDLSLCKCIMNEYAIKRSFEKPCYVTKHAQGLVPIFISDLVLNGVTYTGKRAKTKKEAERCAAYAAILSIMDSESKMTMAEIIKSKEKFYALLHDDGDSDNVTDSGRNNLDLNMSLSKRKETDTPEEMNNISSLDVESNAITKPFHEFKKPKVDSSLEIIPYPITFVPAHPPKLEFVQCSSSGTKKSSKNNKSQTIVEGDTQVTDSVMLLGQVPPCSVTQ